MKIKQCSVIHNDIFKFVCSFLLVFCYRTHLNTYIIRFVFLIIIFDQSSFFFQFVFIYLIKACNTKNVHVNDFVTISFVGAIAFILNDTSSAPLYV